MNAFSAIVFTLAIASATASHLVHETAHIPSGSVSVGQDGVVIAGPSGSVHTDNGLNGHGASAKVSGPAGYVDSQAGHVRVTGPGLIHQDHVGRVIAAPVVHQVPITHTTVVGPSSYARIVGPTSHATLVAPVASVNHVPVVQSWGHQEVIAAPAAHSWGHQDVIAVPAVQSWEYHGVVSHGLVSDKHHGW